MAWYYEENYKENNSTKIIDTKLPESGDYPNVTIAVDEFNQGCKTDTNSIIPNWKTCNEEINKKLGCADSANSPSSSNVFTDKWWNDIKKDTTLYYCNSSDDRHTDLTGDKIYLIETEGGITAYYNWESFIIAYKPFITTKESASALTRLAGFGRQYNENKEDVTIVKIENGFEVSNIYYDYGEDKCNFLNNKKKYERHYVKVRVSTDGEIVILNDKVTMISCPGPID